MIKWDFLGKPHARLLSGRELSFACFSFYSKSICWLLNTYMDRHKHTYRHTYMDTILSATHSHRVTHTLRHRESDSANHLHIQTLMDNKTHRDTYRDKLTHTWAHTSFRNSWMMCVWWSWWSVITENREMCAEIGVGAPIKCGRRTSFDRGTRKGSSSLYLRLAQSRCSVKGGLKLPSLRPSNRWSGESSNTKSAKIRIYSVSSRRIQKLMDFAPSKMIGRLLPNNRDGRRTCVVPQDTRKEKFKIQK